MKVTQEPDRLSQRVILQVAAASVVVTALGVVIVWVLMRLAPQRPTERTVWARSPSVPQEVNAMEMTLFSRLPAGEAAARREGAYRWVDRERGIVALPIDRAIELYLSRQPVTQIDQGRQP